MRTLAKGMDGVNDDGFSQEKRLLAWEHPMTSIQVEHGREKGARRGGGDKCMEMVDEKEPHCPY